MVLFLVLLFLGTGGRRAGERSGGPAASARRDIRGVRHGTQHATRVVSTRKVCSTNTTPGL